MSKCPVAGVIMAAGMSQRLGRPKQLLKIEGKYLLETIVKSAINSELEEVFLVLGSQQEKILNQIPRLTTLSQLTILSNSDYTKGMSSSVKLGLEAVQKKYGHVMFLVVDQPFISPQFIDSLIKNYRLSEKQICVPICQGRKGSPTIFGSKFFDQLMQISGDKGGREIIENNPDDVLLVRVASPKLLFDIDSQSDLESAYFKFKNIE